VVLSDVTKLANLVHDVTVGLGADVAVAEFGSLWDLEAIGIELDWSMGAPRARPVRAVRRDGGDLRTHGRGPVVLEAVRRLRGVLGDRAVVAAGVTGPETLAEASGLPPADAARVALAAARHLCDAGAQIVWVVETLDRPAETGTPTTSMTSVWGTIRFYGALGVLHVGGRDGWVDYVAAGGPYVCCFDPDRAPALDALVADSRVAFALALPLGPPTSAAARLGRSGGCVLVTNDSELAGRVPARELRGAVEDLRAATI
jgi:hypothetical protein